MSAAALPSSQPSARAADASPVTVVAITGVGRSGTTLLERLLGALPGFAPLGEVLHLADRGLLAGERCGCGEPFAACAFWRGVGERAFGGWQQVDAAALRDLTRAVDRHRRLVHLLRPMRRSRRQLSAYQQHLLALYRAAAEVAGGAGAPAASPAGPTDMPPVVIDSSKHPSHAYALRRAEGVDLRVVLVVRDPRGVAASWRRRVRRPEAVASDALMARAEPWRIGVRWLAWNGLTEMLDVLGTPVLRVRYEDLVVDPAGVLQAVARFAGRPVGGDDTAFLHRGGDGTWTARLGPVHSVAGNPMRFRHGDIPLTEDAGWRTTAPARGDRIVSWVTAPLRAAYGYGER